MATIKDVARQAGVSISTVSRVINHSAPVIKAKYDAVCNAMSMLDYQPNTHAQALVRKYSNTVGFMVEDVESPFFGVITREVERVLSGQNKHLVLNCNHMDGLDEYVLLQRLLVSTYDALIIQTNKMTDVDLAALLRHKPTAVIFGRRLSALAHRCIYPDYMKAGFRAAQYLTDIGHKKVGFICDQGNSVISQLLKEGYRLAFREKSLVVNVDLLIESFSTTDGGYTAARDLLKKVPGLTGLICSSDIIASGALKALQKYGKRVPREVSVIACENTGIADYLSPALTTVRYPIEMMARYAATLALTSVQQQGYTSLEEPERQNFSPVLIVRDSAMPVVKVY